MKSIFSIILILIISNPAIAGLIKNAKVIRVLDGDTIDIIADKKYRIRFADIDAPEKAQNFGMEAQRFLSQKIQGAIVNVTVKTSDKYGRFIGVVYLGEENINRLMVDNGAAWVYRAYCKDEILYSLEMNARMQKKGLWSNNLAQPPWKYRLSHSAYSN
ncbi:thermonuclease family protein [Cronobacter sakazakii]|nr:thermonuclease family protein [Cronobacter sakazakii]